MEVGVVGGVCVIGLPNPEKNTTAQGVAVVVDEHGVRAGDGELGTFQTLTWVVGVGLRNRGRRRCFA